MSCLVPSIIAHHLGRDGLSSHPFPASAALETAPHSPQTIFPAFLKHAGLKSFILGIAGPDEHETQLSKCLNIHPQQAKKLGATKNSRCNFDD